MFSSHIIIRGLKANEISPLSNIGTEMKTWPMTLFKFTLFQFEKGQCMVQL